MGEVTEDTRRGWRDGIEWGRFREGLKKENDMFLVIDGERFEVVGVDAGSYLPMVELDDGREFYLARDSEEAGKAAREYWEDLARDDPEEFAELVGTETLVAWALAQWGGPGSTKVTSLENWLNLWLDTPEEGWARYDGIEVEVDELGEKLADELGWEKDGCVGYRWN